MLRRFDDQELPLRPGRSRAGEQVDPERLTTIARDDDLDIVAGNQRAIAEFRRRTGDSVITMSRTSARTSQICIDWIAGERRILPPMRSGSRAPTPAHRRSCTAPDPRRTETDAADPALQHALEAGRSVAGRAAAGIVAATVEHQPCRRSPSRDVERFVDAGQGLAEFVAHVDQTRRRDVAPARCHAPRPDRRRRRYRPGSCCPYLVSPQGKPWTSEIETMPSLPSSALTRSTKPRAGSRVVWSMPTMPVSTTEARKMQTLLGHISADNRPVRRRVPKCRCADIPSSRSEGRHCSTIAALDGCADRACPPITTSGPTIRAHAGEKVALAVVISVGDDGRARPAAPCRPAARHGNPPAARPANPQTPRARRSFGTAAATRPSIRVQRRAGPR